jgi:CSLREA domain-containing protein
LFVVVAGSSGALERPAAAAVRPNAGTTITVNTTVDAATDGNCSLREAVQAANTDTAVDACPAGNGADTIDLPAGHYTLVQGPLEVTSDIAIIGDAGTLIDGDAIHCCLTTRALHVNTGATLTLGNVSVQNSAPAIRNDGTLVMNGGNLDDNMAQWHNQDGSNGIANFGTATLDNVLIRYTANAITNLGTFNATGAVFDHDPTVNDFATINNAGPMSLNRSRFLRTITCGCSSRVIVTGGHPLTITNSEFAGNSGTFVIQNLLGPVTIVDSAFDDNAGVPIWNQASLTVTGTRFSGNRAAHAHPGAILNDGQLDLSGSTIDHNVGDTSGGILNWATMTLTNDTIADNVAQFDSVSGANLILPSGAFTNAGTAMIRNTTIAGNTMLGFHDWRWHAGGIVTMAAPISIGPIFSGYTAMSNSILSDNTAPAPVQSQDCYGLIHSLGYNLVENSTDCFVGATTTGNVIGSTAHLRALAPNGGPTMTMLPPWDSPVVDTGNLATTNDADATTCFTTDQRGVTRPRDGNADGISRCDIGAVER